MNDFILNNEQYAQLKMGYEQELSPTPKQILNELNTAINTIKNNHFHLPINMQNNIINSLQQSHQVLSMTTTTINQSENFLDLKNNPFSLLNFLCNISKTLTSISIKSPYQIMYLKSNSFILDCIVKISNYFETKNIKMYKFM